MNTEHIILNHLARRPDSSQRELSRIAEISLGQINVILRQLCDNGLVRREAASKKKDRYLLTQRGMAERALRSNERILAAINDYKGIKESIKKLLTGLYNKGFREFVLEGESDGLSEIISDVFDDNFRGMAKLSWAPLGSENYVILNLSRRFGGNEKNAVDVLNEIAGV